MQNYASLVCKKHCLASLQSFDVFHVHALYCLMYIVSRWFYQQSKIYLHLRLLKQSVTSWLWEKQRFLRLVLSATWPLIQQVTAQSHTTNQRLRESRSQKWWFLVNSNAVDSLRTFLVHLFFAIKASNFTKLKYFTLFLITEMSITFIPGSDIWQPCFYS